MKTIDKKEAVRAFADGKRVEVMGYSGVWAEVKHYSCFDADTGFRIAATDNDAEWLRKIPAGPLTTDRLTTIADRIEADKARIAELEKWKAEMLEVESEWDEQAVGLQLGMTLGMPIRKNIMPYIVKMRERIAELEGELAKHLEPAWIPHDGGPMPCDGKLLVDITSAEGTTDTDYANRFYWNLKGNAEIIAWRPAKGGAK